MDHGEGNGRGNLTRGNVYKDGGPGGGGAPHQAPGGPDTYGHELGFLHGTTTGTYSGGYYRGQSDCGCWETFRGRRTGGDRLRVIATSVELRLIVGDFVEWLGNGRPPWAAYRALMSGRLIAPDKQPGTRPVGVGQTWRRMMAKCLLRVAGPEAKAACVMTQLAGGMEAGIEGAIHVMHVL